MPEAMSLLSNLASSFSRSLSSLSRSLSSLSSSSNSKCSPTSRSSFDFDGTVGLGIVAAMTAAGGGCSPPPPPGSEPLPILSVAAATADEMMTRTEQQRVISIPNWQQEEEEDDIDEADEDEESWSSMEIDKSSESYTCVTSYVGGQPVSKTVYIDDDSIQIISPPISLSKLKSIKSKSILFIGSPPSSPKSSPLLPRLGEDFLSSCHFCKRSLLHRCDIFMYRGVIPFCSQECRYQHVLNDKHQDSCAFNALELFDGSPPPVCSTGKRKREKK